MPTQNRVTQDQIDQLAAEAKWDFIRISPSMTLGHCRLPNGFELTATSACVDPDNYDHEIGSNICRQRILDKLWELEGYALMDRTYRKDLASKQEALEALKEQVVREAEKGSRLFRTKHACAEAGEDVGWFEIDVDGINSRDRLQAARDRLCKQGIEALQGEIQNLNPGDKLTVVLKLEEGDDV